MSRTLESAAVTVRRISLASASSLSSIPAVPRPALRPTTTSFTFETVVVTPFNAPLTSSRSPAALVRRADNSVGSALGIVACASACGAWLLPGRTDR